MTQLLNTGLLAGVGCQPPLVTSQRHGHMDGSICILDTWCSSRLVNQKIAGTGMRLFWSEDFCFYLVACLVHGSIQHKK